MSIEKTIKEIKFEIEEIENLFELYKEDLFDLINEPNLLELTGAASVLHSFYSGIEKIFLSIAKNVDKNVPFDINWHKTLLSQMGKENDHRESIISRETQEALSEYLAFRHFFRHSYSSNLKWKKMENLVTLTQTTWGRLKVEILTFIKALEQREK